MFNWEDFLRLAESYIGSSSETELKEGQEAQLRTAISRAYYAAHHLSKNFCIDYLKISGITAGPRDHRIVIEKLTNHGSQILHDAGIKLGRLHKDRLKADYDKNFPGNIIKQADYDVKQAKSVSENLSHYLKPSTSKL